MTLSNKKKRIFYKQLLIEQIVYIINAMIKVSKYRKRIYQSAKSYLSN